jgi:hypothetical protein
MREEDYRSLMQRIEKGEAVVMIGSEPIGHMSIKQDSKGRHV